MPKPKAKPIEDVILPNGKAAGKTVGMLAFGILQAMEDIESGKLAHYIIDHYKPGCCFRILITKKKEKSDGPAAKAPE